LAEAGGDFEARVFTAAEREDCRHRADKTEALGARFAAKEACFKALGRGLGQGLAFQQIEVTADESGRPELRLAGAAAARADPVCRRAEPLTCVMAGSAARCSGRTSTVMIMNGSSVPGATSNQRGASSTDTAGANGRNASRIFTMALMRSRMPGWPGSARM